MITIQVHDRSVDSIFDLLGQDENDLTFALGWCLSQCAEFLGDVLNSLGLPVPDGKIALMLQKRGDDGGITDIELHSQDLHFIIEAKRSYQIPSAQQLQTYCARLQTGGRKTKSLVVLTNWDERSVRELGRIPTEISGVEIKILSWPTVLRLAQKIRPRSLNHRKLMHDLAVYLEKNITMQRVNSNQTYVVALSNDMFKPINMTFIDVVEKVGLYFHPFGVSGWPKEPPTYLGFRYYGELQSIHFVEKFDILTDWSHFFPGAETGSIDPHLLYKLGPAIKPKRCIRSGNIRNARLWCALDLLLTAESVHEASSQSRVRENVSIEARRGIPTQKSLNEKAAC